MEITLIFKLKKEDILKYLDRSIGSFICTYLAPIFALKKKRKRTNLNSILLKNEINILIIKLCCLGDAILLIPSIRNIRRKFKNAKISVLTTYRTSRIFNNVSYIDKVYELPKKNFLLKLFFLIRLLKKEKFDLLFNYNPWYNFMILLSLFLRAKIRIGYFYSGSEKLSNFYDFSVEYTENKHVVLTYLDLLKIIGIEYKDSYLEFFFDPKAELFATEYFFKNKFKQPVIAIFPGSSKGWALKRWPLSNYSKLADKLIYELGADVILLSGNEENLANIIMNGMKYKPYTLSEKIDIFRLASIISKCSLLIVGDTAPMHIAASVKTPIVAIFSSVSPVPYHPWMDKDRYKIVRNDIPCSPCTKFGNMKPCLYEFKCIRGIGVDEVFQATKDILMKIYNIK